jgi:hypothetical protein
LLLVASFPQFFLPLCIDPALPSSWRTFNMSSSLCNASISSCDCFWLL